jgi:integrase
LDRQLREREAARRASLRARAFARSLMSDPETGPVSVPAATVDHRRKRLPLSDALTAAGRYADVSPTAARIWKRFARSVNVRYMDELTPQIVHAYLEQFEHGKTYNQRRWAIGRVCSLTRMESGLDQSPVDVIPSRRNDSRHQRPITEPEFVRLYQAAAEPWRTAVLIAWHTGLRERDVAALRWDQITDGVILTTPGKTARFGRSVRIPVHPQLAAALDALPRVNDYVLGKWLRSGQVQSQHRRQFASLLASVGIASNADGLVCFNSLRDSFVSRLDAAGIPRHAIRGMVGHTSDEMTDLYSHDLKSAQKILDLPAPRLDPPPPQN